MKREQKRSERQQGWGREKKARNRKQQLTETLSIRERDKLWE